MQWLVDFVNGSTIQHYYFSGKIVLLVFKYFM